MDKIQAIVTDIEGTTTPIPFVKDTLFPYFKQRLPLALKELWHDAQFKNYLQDLQKQSIIDVESNVEGAVPIPELDLDVEKSKQAIIKNIEWQMSIDRKQAALKNLQGFLWRTGYESGQIKSYCYPDVKQAFERWNQRKIPIYIYSSGSIEAQILLFKYTEEGDLLKYLKGHFDTVTAGPKTNKESYIKIAEQIGFENNTDTILFLSDNVLELDAALEAGYQVKLLIRPQNYHLDEHVKAKYDNTTTFDSL